MRPTGYSDLTTLAPDSGAAILDDALPNDITLFELAVDPAALWEEQIERFRRCRQAFRGPLSSWTPNDCGMAPVLDRIVSTRSAALK
jgi:hypothetical protein